MVLDKSLPVRILDDRGISFYNTDTLDQVPDSFNLPSGNYIVDSGRFKPMAFPIKFKTERLPFPEIAFSPAPFNFEIVFADNKNKCSIYWKEKMIVFDNSFKECPLPQFYFILFHEYGHSLYGYGKLYTAKESEAYCDLYASNKMLDLGFNPSQIMNAPKDTLSSRQDYRKDYIENTLIANA